MDIVVGLGETGRPLYNVLSRAYPDTYGYDLKETIGQWKDEPVRFLNICLPYVEGFIDIVKDYQSTFEPELTIIHSTVPIGTTSLIPNAVHSPILGKHGSMEKSILSFKKYISGPRSNDAHAYLSDAGIKSVALDTKSETTEALKLFCLAKYGMSIAFAEYQKEVCDKYGIDYKNVLLWDENYNAHVASHLQRPLITPPDGRIGGHCVTQNMVHLNRQHPNPILGEILKYADKPYKSWGISNIYPSAKIGRDVNIGTFCEIGANVVIGDRVRIGAMSFIPEGVVIEDDAWIGPKVCFTNDRYPPSGKDNWEKTIIKKGARLGAGVTVLCGITIGEGALIGAGSVVTRDVPANEIWAGVPASKLKESGDRCA